jgi:hypothetical protein
MAAICREDLLDCLRKLEQERCRCREEADKRDLGSTGSQPTYWFANDFEDAANTKDPYDHEHRPRRVCWLMPAFTG